MLCADFSEVMKRTHKIMKNTNEDMTYANEDMKNRRYGVERCAREHVWEWSISK